MVKLGANNRLEYNRTWVYRDHDGMVHKDETLEAQLVRLVLKLTFGYGWLYDDCHCACEHKGKYTEGGHLLKHRP
jgi:hypothetical protein